MGPNRSRLVILALSLLPLGLFACDEPTPTAADMDQVMVEGNDAMLHGGGPNQSIVPVFNYPQFTEELGYSKLVRHRRSVRYQVKTTGLNPGHAYTLWMVVFNNPGECATDPCTDPDVFKAGVDGDLLWAGGTVVGHSGKARFSGRRRVGQSRGSVMAPLGIPAPGVTNPRGADIRFIVHDHGPKDRRYMPDMIRSIDGGCTDAGVPFAGAPSPFNDYNGPRVLPGYGRRGDNKCVSVQAAGHIPS